MQAKQAPMRVMSHYRVWDYFEEEEKDAMFCEDFTPEAAAEQYINLLCDNKHVLPKDGNQEFEICVKDVESGYSFHVTIAVDWYPELSVTNIR